MSEFPQNIKLERLDAEKPYSWDYFLIFQYSDGSERKFFLQRVAFGSFHINKYEFIHVAGQKVVSIYFEGNAGGQEYESWAHFDLESGQEWQQYQFKKPWELDGNRKQHPPSGKLKGSLPFEPVSVLLTFEPTRENESGSKFFLVLRDRQGIENKISISEIVFLQGGLRLVQWHIHEHKKRKILSACLAMNLDEQELKRWAHVDLESGEKIKSLQGLPTEG